MTYSLDFRQQLLKIKAKENLSIHSVAKRFGVSPRTVQNWLVRVTPCKQRNKPATKIDMSELTKDCKQYPDSFYYERAQRLGVSKSGIFYAMRRLGISYKKNT